MLTHGDTFTKNGRAFLVEVLDDDSYGAPWKAEDGHGPVSDWERRAKMPGELILAQDRDSFLFYDFAEACRIARRDGWGFMPFPVETDRQGPQVPYRAGGGTVTAGPFEASDGTNFNRAVSAVYAQHRATMSAREYAARAARADYERLRRWCDNQWRYVGVVVTALCPCCGEKTSESESLWGIESDCADHIHDTAHGLAAEMAEPVAA